MRGNDCKRVSNYLPKVVVGAVVVLPVRRLTGTPIAVATIPNPRTIPRRIKASLERVIVPLVSPFSLFLRREHIPEDMELGSQ